MRLSRDDEDSKKKKKNPDLSSSSSNFSRLEFLRNIFSSLQKVRSSIGVSAAMSTSVLVDSSVLYAPTYSVSTHANRGLALNWIKIDLWSHVRALDSVMSIARLKMVTVGGQRGLEE